MHGNGGEKGPGQAQIEGWLGFGRFEGLLCRWRNRQPAGNAQDGPKLDFKLLEFLLFAKSLVQQGGGGIETLPDHHGGVDGLGGISAPLQQLVGNVVFQAGNGNLALPAFRGNRPADIALFFTGQVEINFKIHAALRNHPVIPHSVGQKGPQDVDDYDCKFILAWNFINVSVNGPGWDRIPPPQWGPATKASSNFVGPAGIEPATKRL